MPVSCQRIIDLLEVYAPQYLAETWDSIGLQIGEPGRDIATVFLSLDLNEEVLDEAVATNADLMIVHHTPFFKPLKNLRTDLPSGRLITRIIKEELALYTAHTNLDAAESGVNHLLAQKLALEEVTPLSTVWTQKLYKLVVYVPEEYTDAVGKAICQAGAGWIGDYKDCTFRLKGQGSFRPLQGANPFRGKIDQLERVAEDRVETIVPEESLNKVLEVLHKTHPYEEIAYDIYLLHNEGKEFGWGCLGKMPRTVTLRGFIQVVKEALGIEHLRYCGDEEKEIKQVALCGGSGISLLPQVIDSKAQVFLTADIKHHEAQEALANGLALVDAGHFATENLVVPVLARYLERGLEGENIRIVVSKTKTDPFKFALG